MLQENTPLLQTERLVLRKFTVQDIDDILLLYGDEAVNTFLPWFPLKTRKQAAEYLDSSILPCYEKGAAYKYAIALKADNRAIGYVGIDGLATTGGSHDLGYGLRKEFWHRGITTEACTAVCDRFKAAGYAYVTATHDVHNPHSGAVMKKLGMRYCYSYEEMWQPKNFKVLFRMYQLDFSNNVQTYTGYQKEHPYFIEAIE